MRMPSLKLPKFIKSVQTNLAAINGVFVLTGIVLLIVGIVVLVQNAVYDDLLTIRFYTVPGFAVATGVLIFLLAVLGFYAALSEKFYFIAGFVVALVVILIFEASLTIAAYKLKSDTTTEIRAPMVASRELYDSRRDVAKLWDELHTEFECCGVMGVNDWQSTRVPVSCCHIDYGTISPFECNVGAAYNIGCMTALGDWLSYNIEVLAITALVVTCVQIVLTAYAAWLAWRSRFESVELES